MKQTICLSALLMLVICKAQAQKIYHDEGRKRPHMCVATKVGIASLSVGCVATIGGLLMEWSAGATYEHSQTPGSKQQALNDENTGAAVRNIGLGLAVGGFVCMVCGIVADAHHMHMYNHKLSWGAPKKNEFGFAYNF